MSLPATNKADRILREAKALLQEVEPRYRHHLMLCVQEASAGDMRALSKSERAVQAALDELMRGRTTLVIAHRLSTIEHADRIVVLVGGHIVETGSHAELLEKNEVYANLYHLQFAKETA